MTRPTPPPTLADELRRLTALELSVPAKIRYVALLIGASTMTAVVGALLLTERALPPRTSIALAVMTLIGVSWAGFACWVLTRKRILLGKERLVASRFAVTFSAVFALGMVLAGYSTGNAAALAAAAVGAVMCMVAVVMWVRARIAFAKLSSRRAFLERELGGMK